MAGEGYSYTRIETSLLLKPRTCTRWCSEDVLSDTDEALLRVIHAFPWVIDVAARQYRPSFAKKKLLEQARDFLCDEIRKIEMLVEEEAKPPTMAPAPVPVPAGIQLYQCLTCGVVMTSPRLYCRRCESEKEEEK